jgi:hypothetical protein
MGTISTPEWYCGQQEQMTAFQQRQVYREGLGQALSKRSSTFLYCRAACARTQKIELNSKIAAGKPSSLGTSRYSQWGVLNEESGLLPVRNPDVFHLNGVVEEPTAFALIRIEPVDGPAFVRKHLL